MNKERNNRNEKIAREKQVDTFEYLLHVDLRQGNESTQHSSWWQKIFQNKWLNKTGNVDRGNKSGIHRFWSESNLAEDFQRHKGHTGTRLPLFGPQKDWLKINCCPPGYIVGMLVEKEHTLLFTIVSIKDEESVHPLVNTPGPLLSVAGRKNPFNLLTLIAAAKSSTYWYRMKTGKQD